jgi:hypothetical protein
MDQNVFDQLVDLKKKQLGLAKKETAAAPKEPERIRTLGNLDTIVESQRIFNPQLPPTNPNITASDLAQPAPSALPPIPPALKGPPAQPALKGPPAKMIHTGTVGASDLEGSWGKPSEEK